MSVHEAMQDLERRLVRRVLCFRVSPDRAAVYTALTVIENHFQAVVPIDALAAKQHLAHDDPDVPEISFFCEDVRIIRFLWSQPERRQCAPKYLHWNSPVLRHSIFYVRTRKGIRSIHIDQLPLIRCSGKLDYWLPPIRDTEHDLVRIDPYEVSASTHASFSTRRTLVADLT